VSIKNQVATSILHIHLFDQLVVKTLHQAVNISTMEVELFAIRCSINQAVGILNIKKIIIITNSLHTVRRIFNLLSCHTNLESSSKKTSITASNSGIVLAKKTGIYIWWSTKSPRALCQQCASQVYLLGISAKSKYTTTLYLSRR